jgi:hypothetical protein
VIANQSWHILTRFTARDSKQKRGWEWFVSLDRNNWILICTRYYSSERNAKRAANRALDRLFPDTTP